MLADIFTHLWNQNIDGAPGIVETGRHQNNAARTGDTRQAVRTKMSSKFSQVFAF
jgi:hypothetical protein